MTVFNYRSVQGQTQPEILALLDHIRTFIQFSYTMFFLPHWDMELSFSKSRNLPR